MHEHHSPPTLFSTYVQTIAGSIVHQFVQSRPPRRRHEPPHDDFFCRPSGEERERGGEQTYLNRIRLPCSNLSLHPFLANVDDLRLAALLASILALLSSTRTTLHRVNLLPPGRKTRFPVIVSHRRPYPPPPPPPFSLSRHRESFEIAFECTAISNGKRRYQSQSALWGPRVCVFTGCLRVRSTKNEPRGFVPEGEEILLVVKRRVYHDRRRFFFLDFDRFKRFRFEMEITKIWGNLIEGKSCINRLFELYFQIN